MTAESPTPEIAADTRCHTGEGPLWHPEEEVVYFLDIPSADLYRYDPAVGSHERVLDSEGSIGGFTIQESGELLLFCDEGRIQPWSPESGLGEPLVEAIDGEERSRFNDVIADPEGRVFCGTMPTPEGEPGALYRLDTDGSLSVAVEDAELSNGLGFTPDHQELYFTETEAGRISRYRYDRATGELSDRETFLDASDLDGHPDGMTVDAEGCVWSAFWNGGRIARYDPDGTELQRVEFPAKKVSAVTFGGPDYETAYVTTALGPGEGPAGTREEEGDGAGALFEVDLGVGGVPEFRSRVEY
ncbi:SMP-30/gluconolactonase/LRE family protein [Halosimplex pelagicum]|uniref:SMP-30/gluconolactonase/LRE family protein n=1 Tax=Halosimplex pelagicum TaxID=869886 RepID=A0A7D5PHB3_9EURY|nr:SMP-30/gluconolactonase/LRE family protein [Halosimplex pelagicum]QLH85059.1 SMP-30/gluconolactonase/LRE family protein [Halosimplex pelagicum]